MYVAPPLQRVGENKTKKIGSRHQASTRTVGSRWMGADQSRGLTGPLRTCWRVVARLSAVAALALACGPRATPATPLLCGRRG